MYFIFEFKIIKRHYDEIKTKERYMMIKSTITLEADVEIEKSRPSSETLPF